MSSVARPAPPTSQNHGSVPPMTGHSRASRKTPAFTMVAECRYDDTGVGAAMALGSQKWNGNCALLVNAPSSTSTSAVRYMGWSRTSSAAPSTRSRS